MQNMPTVHGAADTIRNRQSTFGGIISPIYTAAATTSMTMPTLRRCRFPSSSMLPASCACADIPCINGRGIRVEGRKSFMLTSATGSQPSPPRNYSLITHSHSHSHRQALSLIIVNTHARRCGRHKRRAGILNGLVFCSRKIQRICNIHFRRIHSSFFPACSGIGGMF